MPWLQLQFDYDLTTIRLRSDYDVSHTPASIWHEQKMNVSIFRRSHIVVVSYSNRNCDISLRRARHTDRNMVFDSRDDDAIAAVIIMSMTNENR